MSSSTWTLLISVTLMPPPSSSGTTGREVAQTGCSIAPNPAFVCLKHEDGSNPGLFMKNLDGEWWAFHYEASGCKPMHVPDADE